MTSEQRDLYDLEFAGMGEEEVLELLREWHDEGGCITACEHGEWTEPDGTCWCGAESWLRVLGFI